MSSSQRSDSQPPERDPGSERASRKGESPEGVPCPERVSGGDSGILEELAGGLEGSSLFPGLDGLFELSGDLPLIEMPPGEDLVAIGGDLSPERLLRHYSQGLFPWYEDGSPILWWSPDPRAILPLDGLHVSRRLRRTLRQEKFEVTLDRDFLGVIRGCQVARREGTWITSEMLEAYVEMHRLGHAHSVEVWHEGELAGGIYGLAFGGFFAGESMFYRVRDASKVAMVHLVEHLDRQGFELFDLQIINDHTASLGGVEISREAYLDRLAKALHSPVKFLP